MKRIFSLFLVLFVLTASLNTIAQTTDPNTAAAQKKADKAKARAEKKAAREKAKADKQATTPATPASPATPPTTKPNITQPVNKSADKAVGTDAKGRTIYEGPRGGRYVLSKNGNKEYIKKN
ncbi:MAG: hypothetical protein J0H74_06720 [Chitinophagaceae bacterium]|nr:hypothetical protein [Chitinophagaceae bacterium]